MEDYATELYSWLSEEDPEFSKSLSLEDFKKEVQNQEYTDELYTYLAEQDSSFSPSISYPDFVTSLSGKKIDETDEVEVESQYESDLDDVISIESVEAEYNPYLDALKQENQTIEKDKDGNPLTGQALEDKIAEVEAEKAKVLGLIGTSDDPKTKERLRIVNEMQKVQTLAIPTEEDIQKSLNAEYEPYITATGKTGVRKKGKEHYSSVFDDLEMLNTGEVSKEEFDQTLNYDLSNEELFWGALGSSEGNISTDLLDHDAQSYIEAVKAEDEAKYANFVN